MKITDIELNDGVDYGVTTSHTANIVIDNKINVTAIVEKYKCDNELEFMEIIENNGNVPIKVIERLINEY